MSFEVETPILCSPYIEPDRHWLDGSKSVAAWVKNAGLGLVVPYEHNGEKHDYQPDFIVRLAGPGERHLLLEAKGYDVLVEVKKAAAERWCSAVNADGRYGEWSYRITYKEGDLSEYLMEAVQSAAGTTGV